MHAFDSRGFKRKKKKNSGDVTHLIGETVFLRICRGAVAEGNGGSLVSAGCPWVPPAAPVPPQLLFCGADRSALRKLG